MFHYTNNWTVYYQCSDNLSQPTEGISLWHLLRHRGYLLLEGHGIDWRPFSQTSVRSMPSRQALTPRHCKRYGDLIKQKSNVPMLVLFSISFLVSPSYLFFLPICKFHSKTPLWLRYDRTTEHPTPSYLQIWFCCCNPDIS